MPDSPPLFESYLTTTQASARTRLSREQIANLCRRGPANGGIVCIKVTPRLWMVNEQSLAEYLASNPKPGPKRKQK